MPPRDPYEGIGRPVNPRRDPYEGIGRPANDDQMRALQGMLSLNNAVITAATTPRRPTTPPPVMDPIAMGQNALMRPIMAAGNAGARLAERILPGRPAPQAQSTGEDVTRGVGSGLMRALPFMTGATVRGDAQAMANTVAPVVTGALTGASRDRVAQQVQELEEQRRAFGHMSTGDIVNTPLGEAVGMAYEPNTAPGRMAQRGAQMAPFAAIPGGVIPTIAGFGGSEAARAGATAAGRSPEEIEAYAMGGGLAGGVAGALRPSVARAPARNPRSIDPDVSVAQRDLDAAAGFVRSRIPNNPPEMAPVLAERGATVAEQAGRPAQAALGAVARTRPDVGVRLDEMAVARALDRPERIQSDVGRATGVEPSGARDMIDALVQRGRAEADPLFRQARARTDPITSPRLSQLSETPVIQRALRDAYEDLLNDPDGPPPAAVARTTPEGQVVMEPTMEAWDLVYSAMQRQVERNPNTGRPLSDQESPGNYRLNTLRRALRQELENQSPEWGAAMRRAGDYQELRSAFEQGGSQLFSSRIRPQEYARQLERQSPAARRAWLAGQADAARRIFENSSSQRVNVFNAPAVRAKLRSTIGPEATNQLIQGMRAEQMMRGFEQRYAPGANSITSEISAALREMNGAQQPGPIAQGARDVVNMGPRRAAMAWAGRGARSLLDQVGQRGMSAAARDEAGRLLMSQMTPEELLAHLNEVSRGPQQWGLGMAPLRVPPPVTGAESTRR